MVGGMRCGLMTALSSSLTMSGENGGLPSKRRCRHSMNFLNKLTGSRSVFKMKPNGWHISCWSMHGTLRKQSQKTCRTWLQIMSGESPVGRAT